jgi:hypothetical protein
MSKHIRYLFAALALTVASVASAATFNLFQPASGILVGNPSTYVTTAATSSNVRSLWTGTCDATTFLRGDGACAIAGGLPGGATTQVQYNNAGAFGGDAGLTYNAGTDTLTAGILTATTGTISPILNSPSAMTLSTTGANGMSFATNGNTRFEITDTGEWLVGGTVGANGQVLASGGPGVEPSWTTVGGGTPGGATTQIQYNNAGAFAGSANFVFDGSNTVTLNGVLKGVTTGGATPGGSLTVSAGDANGSATGGNLTLAAGTGDNGGTLFATGGNADTTFGGGVQIEGGQSSASGGGAIEITGGEGATTGGGVTIGAGVSNNGAGAITAITAGDGGGTNQNGGDLRLGAGVATGSGTNGIVRVRTAGVNRLVIDGVGAWNVSNAGTGTSGQVLTSNGAAAPTWQAAPAPTSSGASATAGGSTSATNGSAVAVALSTEEFDTGNFHDTTTNNSRVILPAGTGYASCSGSISMFTGNTQTNTYMDIRLALRKNGTMYIAQAVDNWFAVSAGSSVFVWLTVANAMIPANGTDYVEMIVLQNGASGAGTITANSNNSSGITRLTCTAV